PALMRSRTNTRRSCASGALESSIDSFWHTMQRKSLDSARARTSSAGFDSISPGSTARDAARANSATNSISACKYFTGVTPPPAAPFSPSPAPAPPRSPRALRRGARRNPPQDARAPPAEKHEDGAEPDHQDMRLEEQPH